MQVCQVDKYFFTWPQWLCLSYVRSVPNRVGHFKTAARLKSSRYRRCDCIMQTHAPMGIFSCVDNKCQKLDSYSKAKHFFIALSHAHFRFWDHERLTDWSISKRYPESNATSWVETTNFTSVSRSWHMILLVTWKRSAWAFYLRVVVWSLNGHVAAHRLVLKKCLAFK